MIRMGALSHFVEYVCCILFKGIEKISLVSAHVDSAGRVGQTYSTEAIA